MKKLIKVLVYLDTDKGEKMHLLLRDIKEKIYELNMLYEKHGLHSIKVTTTGFDYGTEASKGGWGWETEVKQK